MHLDENCPSVSLFACQSTSLDQTKITQQLLDGLLSNFVYTFMVPRGHISLTLVVP